MKPTSCWTRFSPDVSLSCLACPVLVVSVVSLSLLLVTCALPWLKPSNSPESHHHQSVWRTFHVLASCMGIRGPSSRKWDWTYQKVCKPKGTQEFQHAFAQTIPGREIFQLCPRSQLGTVKKTSSKNVVSFALCEFLLVVLLHHFLPLLPRFHRPLLDFANHYFDSCM